MKRASPIKVVLSCTGSGGKKEKKKSNSNYFFSSEIGNFNIGGPVNQLIIKKTLTRPKFWCAVMKSAQIPEVRVCPI
jgi:hypothetical protein